MARPYSQDLRERIARRVEAGDSCRTVASLFGVGVSTVVKVSQRKRATGSAAAKAMGGARRKLVLAKDRNWILERIKKKPDLTPRALLAELHERGTHVSFGALWRFFKREGISFKKKPARIRTG